MFDFVHPSMSTEKMPYGAFNTKYVTRRLGQFGDFYPEVRGMTLPLGSMLHTIRNFTSLSDLDSVVPEVDYPVVTNETVPVYLDIHRDSAHKDSEPFGVAETMRYMPQRYYPQAVSFFKANFRIHRLLTPSRIGMLGSALIWTDYSILKKLDVVGTFAYYRKFDVIFRSILDRIAQVGTDRHHYIWVPQGDASYSKALARKAAEHLWTDSVPDRGDASLYVLIHLFSYVMGLTEKLSVTPYKPEVPLFKTMGDKAPVLTSTSLFSRLPPELLDVINLVLVKDGKCVVYNLGDIRDFGQKPGFFNKLYSHAMGLRTDWLPQEDDHTDVTHPDTVTKPPVSDPAVVDDDVIPQETPLPPRKGIETTSVSAPDTTDATPSSNGTPPKQEEVKEKVPVAPSVVPESQTPPVAEPEAHPEDYETHIRSAIAEQKARLDKEIRHQSKTDGLLEHHLSVQFAGQPIGSYLKSDTARPLNSHTIAHLKSVPDESYQHNRIVSFDQDYRDRGLHQDTAKVLTALTKEGMFIRSVDHSTTITEMDHIAHYKVSLSDVTGKQHSVAFSYPIMDKDGRMRIGGVTYTMRKQIVNVPICKISPTRVNLSSNYNKSIVERVQSVRNRFDVYIGKYLEKLRAENCITAAAGRYNQKNTPLPFDYSAVAQRYQKLGYKDTTLFFQYPHRLQNVSDKKSVETEEKSFGIYLGEGPENTRFYMDMRNAVHQVRAGKAVQSWPSLLKLLDGEFGDKVPAPKMVSEYTNLVLLSGEYPVGIVLAYRFGLKALFDMIHLEYRFYPKGKQVDCGPDEISVQFANGSIVFSRYPLSRSLIAAGLNWADLRAFTTDALEVKSTYADIFESKSLSIHYLKGIDNFFDFFVDPITLEVLKEMKEPTNPRDLLLRANSMLSDWTSEPSSNIQNHRVRGQERFASFLYKELSRELADYRNAKSKKSGFSINPTEVFKLISRDQTVAPSDIINPLHEAKDGLFFTFSGTQGRTQASFVTKDRVAAKDGMGSISEAFPDSGMVGINGYLSTNANITNTRGLFRPVVSDKDIESLTAPEILSVVNMVMPGTTKDGLKRANYASIQASHILPNHSYGQTTSVRTGYDKVIAATASDVFATKATGTGTVVAVDQKGMFVRVKYDDRKLTVLRKEKTNVSSMDIDRGRTQKQLLGILVADTDIDQYPHGGIVGLTASTNGIIQDRIRFTDPTKLPPTRDIPQRTRLTDELAAGKISAIYFVSLELTGITAVGEEISYDFSDVLTPNAGSYILQKRQPLVEVGDRVSVGDILIYNVGFFQPSFGENQVTFKHGVVGTVVLMEKSTNHEDACELSPNFAKKFTTYPSHIRSVNLTADMEVDQIKVLGTFVEATDPLCRLITPDVAALLKSDPTALESGFAQLGKSEPKARYYGEIKDIKFFYSCSKDKLSESLKSCITQYERYVRRRYDLLNVPKDKRITNPGYVEPGSSYHGSDFTEDTVVIEFMITGSLDLGPGDKLCVGNANKTIPAVVSEKPSRLESGEEVDVLFSTKSVENRIVSAFYDGFIERNIHVGTQQGLDLYDQIEAATKNK